MRWYGDKLVAARRALRRPVPWPATGAAQRPCPRPRTRDTPAPTAPTKPDPTKVVAANVASRSSSCRRPVTRSSSPTRRRSPAGATRRRRRRPPDPDGELAQRRAPALPDRGRSGRGLSGPRGAPDPTAAPWFRSAYPGAPTARRAGCWTRCSASSTSSARRWSSTAASSARRCSRRKQIGARASASASPALPRREASSGSANASSIGQLGVRPRAFGTSAYSNLSDWPGGGVVGIHGPTARLIPGRPSHGCIRVRNDRSVLWRGSCRSDPLSIVD